MTAGNNGAGTPEDDDPFAHLYRSEGGEGGAQGAAGGSAARRPGVPRASYNQVRAVGERQYGQRQYGQQQVPAQQPYGQQGQQPYGQQNAHYAAPETLPGGNGTRQGPPPGHGQDGPPRRSHKGLLIGAISVVAVVCIGIGVAMLTNQGDKKDEAGGGDPTPTAGESVKPSDKPSDKPTKAPLPKEDAGALRLDGGAATAKDVSGAKGTGGTYVAGFNKVGASVTWTVDVPNAGDFRLYVRYGIPGKPANATLTVNGKPNAQPLGMKNFTHSPEGDWEKGWQTTWAPITVNKGTNTIKLSCEQGNQCDANIDQLWLAK
ncbi:CBM35 domain-containing protein [Streptomyces rimosus]|uniref:CBM35 domain-containing protein n=1 Tax=Streptomyces rimosus TaxID=1927 RepID=UPI0037901324